VPASHLDLEAVHSELVLDLRQLARRGVVRLDSLLELHIHGVDLRQDLLGLGPLRLDRVRRSRHGRKARDRDDDYQRRRPPRRGHDAQTLSYEGSQAHREGPVRHKHGTLSGLADGCNHISSRFLHGFAPNLPSQTGLFHTHCGTVSRLCRAFSVWAPPWSAFSASSCSRQQDRPTASTGCTHTREPWQRESTRRSSTYTRWTVVSRPPAPSSPPSRAGSPRFAPSRGGPGSSCTWRGARSGSRSIASATRSGHSTSTSSRACSRSYSEPRRSTRC